MAWVLTQGLQAWRRELDAVFPGRDKTSSGTIGDQAHSSGTSGHNPDRTGNAEYRDGDGKDEVRATDEDRDLVPGSGVDWMLRVVRFVVEKARRGEYVPFRYIIYCPAGGSPTIWHKTSGWAARAYTGSNRHDKHAHFSGDWSERGDSWTGTVGIAALRDEGDEMYPINKNSDKEDIVFHQYLLAELGFSPGAPDGVYGEKMTAAVRAYRQANTTADAGGAAITGWHGFHMLRKLAQKHAGKNGERGPAGAPGAPGKDGRDGELGSGTLTVTGGSLRVVQAQEG